MTGTPKGSVPTEFDWLVYADGTFAALALLLPIPFLDALIERFFRRRMPQDIARRRGRTLPLASVRAVNRSRAGFFDGCLMLPVQAVVYLVRNLWRTIMYVLTIVDASEKLSYYWHRAFLLDYMIGRGDLDHPPRAELAAAALHEVLETTPTSPFLTLAREIVEMARARLGALLRAIFRGARRQRTTETKRVADIIAGHWSEFQGYLIDLAARYDATLVLLESKQKEESSSPV